MRKQFLFMSIISFLLLVTSMAAQTTEFVYQGQLENSSVPANGSYDFEFLLFDTLAGPAQIGSTLTQNGVAVTNGIFSVKLDFGAAFPGAARFLEIHVKQNGGGAFTTLTPRQPVSSAPYSVKSLNADTATNATQLGGVTAANYLQTNGDGSGLTNLNGANIANNTISALALAPDTFPSNQNLSRLGQLRWDLLGQRIAAGLGASGVAFDGANIWVANQSGANVTKLRASDGACAGVVGPPTAGCTFAVGSTPAGIAFDGANIWVANFSSNNVTKLRASDGANMGTFATGTGANGVAFDGSNIWVANTSSNNVTKLRASDGACAGVVGPPTPACIFAAGTNPFGVTFDGANIWVTNNSSTNLIKLRASDGALLGTFTVGSSPQAAAFDGANIWVANNSSANVTKLRASDGACAGVVGPPTAACTFAVGSGPKGIAFDGANIWVANFSDNVTKLRASDGAVLGTFVAGTLPRGVAFDGANIWVTNQTSNNVIKLPVFP